MTEPRPAALATGEGFVSTGTMPARDEIRGLIETAYAQFRDERGGQVADYIPALAEADPEAFGICVANTRGDAVALGDAEQPFSIQSVSKPFVFALVCDLIGATGALESTRQAARTEARQASDCLQLLPRNNWTESLL